MNRRGSGRKDCEASGWNTWILFPLLQGHVCFPTEMIPAMASHSPMASAERLRSSFTSTSLTCRVQLNCNLQKVKKTIAEDHLFNLFHLFHLFHWHLALDLVAGRLKWVKVDPTWCNCLSTDWAGPSQSSRWSWYCLTNSEMSDRWRSKTPVQTPTLRSWTCCV